jgi:hypothetical protein
VSAGFVVQISVQLLFISSCCSVDCLRRVVRCSSLVLLGCRLILCLFVRNANVFSLAALRLQANDEPRERFCFVFVSLTISTPRSLSPRHSHHTNRYDTISIRLRAGIWQRANRRARRLRQVRESNPRATPNQRIGTTTNDRERTQSNANLNERIVGCCRV